MYDHFHNIHICLLALLSCFVLQSDLNLESMLNLNSLLLVICSKQVLLSIE